MAHTSWKLIVTPLNADAEAREAVVNADNWLSALRLARKQLGEEGGVPPGASCVMSATGEVTILDPQQRRRYFLARASASVPPPAAVPVPEAKPPAPVSKSTMAYAPSEAAAIRAQLTAATSKAQTALQPPAGSVTKPTPAAAPAAISEPPGDARSPGGELRPQPKEAFAPTMPAASLTAPPVGAKPVEAAPKRPDSGPLRKSTTVAYSPAESASIREQLVKAQVGVADTMRPPSEPIVLTRPAQGEAPKPELKKELPAPLTAQPAKAPVRRSTMAYTPEDSAAVRAQMAAIQATKAPAPAPEPAGPSRTNTQSYSPEEANAARAMLQAAQKALQAGGDAKAPPSAATPPAKVAAPAPAATPAAKVATAPAPVPIAPSAPRKSSTVAYIESPFVGGAMLAIGSRSQEPTGESPLHYRERTYFLPDLGERGRLESLLRAELARIQLELAGRPHGQFVSLAVFDHNFKDRPERPPIATLEWKDWRGEEAVFRQSSTPSGAAWSPVGEGVARPSFMPGVVEPVSLPTPEPAPPSAPAPASFAAQAGREPAPEPLPRPEVERAKPVATAPAQAPASALYTPVALAGGSDSWPNAQGGTGEQDRRLAVAFEAVQDLYFLGTPAEGLAFAVKLLSELVPSQAVSGAVYDINTDEFRVVSATGASGNEVRAAAIPSSVGLLAAAMLSGKETFLVPNVSEEPRFDPNVDGREGIDAQNLLYLPLQKGDVWLGVLQLINRNKPKGFSEGDLAVAAYVGAQVLDFLHQRRQANARRKP